MDFAFDELPAGKAARAKLKDVNPDFRWYIAEWIGERKSDAAALKFTGAQFRVATKGPRKGQLCLMVKGTQRTAVVKPGEWK
jgi:hypothetical protein